jgi:hypothetical protein
LTWKIPPSAGGISADFIWEKKFEKGEENRDANVKDKEG